MEDSEDSTTSSSQSHNQEDFQRAPVPTISKNIETVRAGDLGPVTSWNTLKNTLLDQDQVVKNFIFYYILFSSLYFVDKEKFFILNSSNKSPSIFSKFEL